MTYGHSEHDALYGRPSEAHLDLGGGLRTLHDTGEVPIIAPTSAAQPSAEERRSQLDRDDRDARLESSISTGTDVRRLPADQRERNLAHVKELRKNPPKSEKKAPETPVELSDAQRKLIKRVDAIRAGLALGREAQEAPIPKPSWAK